MRALALILSYLILSLFLASSASADGAKSWQGVYVGAHLGGGRMSSDTVSTFENILLVPPTTDLSDTGILGGAQVGYLWQINRSIVFGVEGDFSFMNAEDRGFGQFFDTLGNNLVIFPNTQIDIDWLASLRGRLGYAQGPLLIYGTGGVAWSKVSMFGEINSPTPNGPPFAQNFYDASDTKIKTGWVAGGGIEYQFNANLIIGAEYLHYDFGEETLASRSIQPGNFFMSYRFDTQVNVGRATIKYKF